jgi:hypothetical protein
LSSAIGVATFPMQLPGRAAIDAENDNVHWTITAQDWPVGTGNWLEE